MNAPRAEGIEEEYLLTKFSNTDVPIFVQSFFRHLNVISRRNGYPLWELRSCVLVFWFSSRTEVGGAVHVS